MIVLTLMLMFILALGRKKERFRISHGHDR
jgi:hypothetical protein